MNHKIEKLLPGLYLVATPLGHSRDITLRALDILASADVLASEDTRTTRKLLEIHGIPLSGRQILAYHDHSKPAERERVLDCIRNGQSVAYMSEAGTPLIADPGYHLVASSYAAGFSVTSAPGPSAVVTALTLAGLPTDQFHFYGFLPNSGQARLTSLTEVLDTPSTSVLYESPRRVEALLEEIVQLGRGDRKLAICREMTKKFEEVIAGTAAEILENLLDHTLKGEIVVVIDRMPDDAGPDKNDIEDALIKALETMRVKDAANMVAGAFNRPKREVYQLALTLSDKS